MEKAPWAFFFKIIRSEAIRSRLGSPKLSAGGAKKKENNPFGSDPKPVRITETLRRGGAKKKENNPFGSDPKPVRITETYEGGGEEKRK